jgi:hypothetical protein
VVENEHALKITGMRVFSVFNDYWLADDGRVYGSAKQEIVTAKDADYAEWIENGNVPKSWPRDMKGKQTNEALQEVLTPYNLFAGLRDYVAFKRRQKEFGGMTSSAGLQVHTDAASQTRIMGLYILQKENPSATTAFQSADGKIHSLEAADILQLVNDLVAHTNDCFMIAGNLIARIDANVIKTRREVDNAFATKAEKAKK